MLAHLLVFLTLSSSVQAGLFSRGSARVLVDSWARPSFTEARMTPEGPKKMTYHIFEGKFHSGNFRDKGLEKTPFGTILDTLASDMEAQNFYPAPSTNEGDMLIVIHWGVTGVEEDLNDIMGDTSFGTDSDFGGDPSEGGDLDTSDSYSDNYIYSENRRNNVSNAKLLGFDKALNKRNLSSSEERELREMLEDERYFIILMAYDWQKMLTEKTTELIWSTRFSLDSLGVSFADAYPALSRGAVPYLATTLNDLSKNRTHLGTGKVKVGELEIVGEVDAKNKKKQKQ